MFVSLSTLVCVKIFVVAMISKLQLARTKLQLVGTKRNRYCSLLVGCVFNHVAP